MLTYSSANRSGWLLTRDLNPGVLTKRAEFLVAKPIALFLRSESECFSARIRISATVSTSRLDARWRLHRSFSSANPKRWAAEYRAAILFEPSAAILDFPV